jgi:tetratricopeptide (TPR) repeat protein
MVGVGGLAAWGWDAGGRSVRRGLIAVLVALAVLSFRQAAVWRDDLVLWENAVRREPGNAFARANLAGALFEASRPAAAREEYLAALARHPSDDVAFAAASNLARIENGLGRAGEGLRWAERALALRPDAREPLQHKIVALHLLGEQREALRLLDEAARRDPDRSGWSALRQTIEGSRPPIPGGS